MVSSLESESRGKPAFLKVDRSEAVDMAVDTRHAGAPACGSAPANVLSEYVEAAGGTRLRVAATQ